MKHLYNSKITIQSATKTKDEYGTWTTVWTDVPGLIDIPCRINWFTARGRGEYVIGDKITWVRDGKVYCDYYSNITTEMRMAHNGNNYDILGLANPDEVDKYMTLTIKRSE